MLLAIIVAVADNGVIGRNGQLPWQLPDDLKRFKALTMGKPVIMGRRTFESIGRALPGRRNLVVSRLALGGSLPAAIERCAGVPEACIIGGAALYAAALPGARLVHLTRVHAQPAGDVRFPELPPAEWREVGREEHAVDARHAHAMSFLTLQRVGDSRQPA